MDYLKEFQSCETLEQLYILWHKIYEREHGEARCDVKEWNTCQFYRFRIEAQIKGLEQKCYFLAPVPGTKKDETKEETP